MRLPAFIPEADDEPLTEEEEQALSRADEWLKARGAIGIPHEEILAEFGLTPAHFPHPAQKGRCR
jgi:hypothetical protein